MAWNYVLRSLSLELHSNWYDSEDAISTIDRSSSPLIPNHPLTGDGIPFLSLNSDDLLSDDIYNHTVSPNPNPSWKRLHKFASESLANLQIVHQGVLIMRMPNSFESCLNQLQSTWSNRSGCQILLRDMNG
jgi:hypothetical protein